MFSAFTLFFSFQLFFLSSLVFSHPLPPPPTSASVQLELTFVHFLVSYLEVFHSSSCSPPFLCLPEAPFHIFPSFFMLLMLSPPDFSTDICLKWFLLFFPNVSVSFCCHIFLEAVLHKIKVRKNYFLDLEKKRSCLARTTREDVLSWGFLQQT